MIEKVSGRRLADFIHERVLGPAHLRHTLFPNGPRFPVPHPHGYTDQTLSGETADTTHWNPSWAWAAGAMISDLHDLRRWAPIVATGKLLSPETQRQRLRTLPTGFPGTSYGLGIFKTNGWIGHNGSIPGYETVTVYLPSKKATLVIMINTDIPYQGQEPSTLLARAITTVATPDNIYDKDRAISPARRPCPAGMASPPRTPAPAPAPAPAPGSRTFRPGLRRGATAGSPVRRGSTPSLRRPVRGWRR